MLGGKDKENTMQEKTYGGKKGEYNMFCEM